MYRHLINEEIQSEVTEAGLKQFEFCLKLLVKIEDDRNDLISTFISIYKHIINKKFDEIFAMRENNFEIDFITYSKIYDNFEFGINENEFIFYEKQVKEIANKDVKENISKDIKFTSITSKKLKKGTFIWMIKKITETVFPFIISSYDSFSSLFGKEFTQEMNKLLNTIVETFFKKVQDFVHSTMEIDCVFFKEGLSCFFSQFCDCLQKINDENIQFDQITEKIVSENKVVTNAYLRNSYSKFLETNCSFLKDSLGSIVTNASYKFNKQAFITEANQVFKKSLESILEFINLLKVTK